MGGVSASNGAWPWQVDIQVGFPLTPSTMSCSLIISRLCLWFNLIAGEVEMSLCVCLLLGSRHKMATSVEAPSSQRNGFYQPLIVSPSRKTRQISPHSLLYTLS